MVDRETFERRLAKLEEVLRHLRRLGGGQEDRFLADPGLQAQGERWLQVASECVLDLSFQLIAEEGWATARTKGEAFEILQRQGVLDEELTQRMKGWAGLRNVLVHVYTRIDHERLWQIVTGELDDLEQFAQAIVEHLG